MAIDRAGSGICIEDATLDVIRGQRAGEHYTQGLCDIWWVGGFEIKDLEPGVEMTLRISAPGYIPTELTVTPVASYVYQAMIVMLDRAR
jgi:hypothetical protein